MKRNQGNKQKNIQSKPLRKIMVMIIAMAFVFTACHKKKKPFLLFPLIDNSSNATTDGGSGSGGGSGNSGSGSGGGVGSSGGGGSGGSGGPTFTPAIGVLDTSFNSPNGYIIQPIDSDNYGQSLAIQPDGKILLGGYCYSGSDWDFCIARFETNGSPDNSFGTGGKVIQPIGSSDDYAYSLAIQPDGKILLGGFCDNGSNYDFCIARFN